MTEIYHRKEVDGLVMCCTEGCKNRGAYLCDADEVVTLWLCESCASFVKESGYHAWRVR